MTLTLSLVLDESSSSDPSIRCKVYEAVIRRKSHSDLKSSTSDHADDEGTVSENDKSSEASREKVHQRRGGSRMVILGPLSPQRIELSSSDSSPSSSSTPPTSRITRSASTSNLDSPTKAEALDLIHTSLSSPVIGSFNSSEKIDWVEYSLPVSDLELEGRLNESSGWPRSESSWNSPTPDEEQVVIVNDAVPELPRCTFDPGFLAKLLQETLGPNTKPIVRPPYKIKTPPLKAVAEHVVKPPYKLKTPPPGPRRPTLSMLIPPPQTPIHKRVGRYGAPPPHTPPSPLTQMRMRGATLPLVKTPNHTRANLTCPSESDDTGSDVSGFGAECAGCGRKKNVNKWMAIEPCGHVLCSTCFSATISSVTTSHGASKCTACQVECVSFNVRNGPPSVREPVKRSIMTIPEDEVFPPRLDGEGPYEEGSTVVVRIDNVAWDITPDIVETFLPRGVLPEDHVNPIHILLDRFDGRTKDYMYVEISNLSAARKILKRRQNAMMPSGSLHEGRKRPVTITMVTHQELAAELRPQSQHELFSLLALCQAAVASPPLTDPTARHSTSYVAPSGLAHFVKSRHGPFYAVMSILTKLRGSESPAYWDLFTVSSGAISALANASRSSHKNIAGARSHPDDVEVLSKLRKLFNRCFGAVSETT